MTDINLKTLTPDTSLPTTGFLFGADSQGAAGPSVYSTQTVATTLLGSTSLTGDTLTADAPVLNLTQTWNNGAVTFTGIKFNAAGSSSTNSSATSLLMDIQDNTSSRFKVDKFGVASITAPASQKKLILDGGGTYPKIQTTGVKNFTLTDGTNDYFQVTVSGGNTVVLLSNFSLGWCSSSTALNYGDTFITRKNTRILQLGEADAATALAQTLSVQSVVAGAITNPAGADFTITGSQGLGSGAGGSIIFKVAPAGTAGNPAQNALEAALTIASTKAATFANTVTATGFVSSGDVYALRQIGLGYTNAFLYAPTAGTLGIYNGSSGSGGFAFIQGKLKTDNARTAGDPSTDGYLVIYDSTGTAYKVPCVAL
jgi:hypothetical protein